MSKTFYNNNINNLFIKKKHNINLQNNLLYTLHGLSPSAECFKLKKYHTKIQANI